jgi:hypothetical protein
MMEQAGKTIQNKNEVLEIGIMPSLTNTLQLGIFLDMAQD